MSTPATPSDPKSALDHPRVEAGQDAPVEVVGLSGEEKLRIFLQNNRVALIAVCVLVLAGIVAKGGWDYFAAQRRASLIQDYAACTTPQMLQSFAAAHSGDPLAGAAELRLADDAYGEGRMAEAATGYERAIAELPAGPFAVRARLGQAMAEIQSSRSAEGETGLRQLANDSALLKGTRAEAAYELASLAASQGRAEEVRKLGELLVQIDPESPWTQRVFALQANLAVAAQAAAPGKMLSLPPAATGH